MIFPDPDSALKEEDINRWYTQQIQWVGFGLVQVQGGPCSIIAALNCFALCELLFGVSTRDLQTLLSGFAFPLAVRSMNDISILPIDAINTAIGNAIAFVLWNSALSVEGSRKIQVVAFTRDGLDSTTFEDFESLSAHCKIHLIEKASSILLLLYSLVFTRGVSTIRDEMREENILVSLVGAHGNCTQSLLNLAVIGKAVPDVLDGCNALFQMEGPSSKTIIGLLSHAESVDSKVIRVGSFFKDPFMPIWIISGESHT